MPTVATKPPLIVNVDIWHTPTVTRFAQHQGERVNFSDYAEARQFAVTHGYSGIRIIHGQDR